MKLVSGMQGTRNQEIVGGDKKRKKTKEHKTAERGTK